MLVCIQIPLLAGMTFMSVLDVVENRVETNTPEEPQLIYKCGLEIEEGQQNTINTAGNQNLNINAIKANVSHA